VALLYYWKPSIYRSDLDEGASYNLNHANSLLHEIEVGDSLWAFTRNSKGDYVLAAELVVKSKTRNSPDFKYGPYRVWGDLNRSRYFDTEALESIESVLRSFNLTANASRLGQSFQGFASVRKLSEEEHRVLAEISKDYPLEQRAKLLPEEKLEQDIARGDGNVVEESLVSYEIGISVQRREYLIKSSPLRNRALAKKLLDLYEGACQICQWRPRDIYGVDACETHHIQWISRGGKDELKNLVLICPNHHRAIHRTDAAFDYGNFSFGFLDHNEILQMNCHL
jgi:hypothetical protein